MSKNVLFLLKTPSAEGSAPRSVVAGQLEALPPDPQQLGALPLDPH